MRRLIFTILLCSSVAFAQNFRDAFERSALDESWILVRKPEPARITLAERPGYLRLKGSTVTLSDGEVPPVYVGRKQAGNDFEATTEIDFKPAKPNESAGLALRRNERAFCALEVRREGDKRSLVLRCVNGSMAQTRVTAPLPDAGNVKLRVRGFAKYYRFSYAVADGAFRDLGGIESKPFEAADGLSEVEVGMFATGAGRESTTPADFSWFEFNPAPKDPYADLVTVDPALPKGWTVFSVDSAEKGIIQKYPYITRPEFDVPADIEVRKGIVYASYGERQMHADLFRPRLARQAPAIVIVHGGAWVSGRYTMEDPLALALAKRGYVTLTIEYRFATEKKFPAQCYDLKAAVRWLRANAAGLGVNPNRIGAAGASSGGHLVAFLGATNDIRRFEGDGGNEKFSSRVQSIVDIDGTATFVDPGNIEKEIKGPWNTNTLLTGFTYAENPEAWKDASPITHVGPKSAPVLFLNSSSNRPYQQREEMAAALNALKIPSEIRVVVDTPHPFWLFRPWFDQTVDEIDGWFKKTMK